MTVLEQVQSLGLEQQKLQENVLEKNSQGLGEKFTPTAAIHEHVDEKMVDNIFAGLRDLYTVGFEYNIASDKPITVAVENMAEGFLKSIEDWKQKKIMLSAPVYVSRGGGAILDYLVKKLDHLKNNDANINEDGKRKLEPVLSEIHDLVSKGNYVSKEFLKLLPNNVLKQREEYLSKLKNIACSGSDSNEEDVVVQKDNVFYCVQYPEESIVSPAKFLSDSEFQGLEGILKIGESNAVKIQNGQYRDIKGKVKMTFRVGDDEKVEMILFSEKAEDFGKIMVRMDDKSCGVFFKHCEKLEEEFRTSEIVEAAKAFVQTKNNVPSSTLDDTNIFQHSKEVLKV